MKYLTKNILIIGLFFAAVVYAQQDTARTFMPNVDGAVEAIAVHGNYTYIGGGFTEVGGEPRERLAKINNQTGAVESWNPGANDWVSSIVISPDGNDIYVGGEFNGTNSIGGQTRNRLAKLNNTNGAADASWNPNASGFITNMAISPDGNDIYVVGNFNGANSINGTLTRNRLAKLNNTDGTADETWNPNASANVRGIAISPDGSSIYVGGDFTFIGGQGRNYLAKLNNTNGNADGEWIAHANFYVRAIAVSADGSSIYVGGLFTFISGESRTHIAKLNNTNGSGDVNWVANTNFNGVVTRIAISADGSNIYVGGFFTFIGGQDRNRLAKLNNTNGDADSWNPDANNDVLGLCLAVLDDNEIIIAGGDFTTIGDNPRQGLALFTMIEEPLPVELISLTASAKQNGIELKWITATEVNNFGFEVERATMNDKLGMMNWNKVGFVEGNGTTNAPKNYSFTDKVSQSGSYSYRLKQIDRDGKFQHSQQVEVEVGSVPKVFALEQNYPNPFNPSTVISYQLPMNSLVTLKVYDILGKEAATLVNEKQEAGSYEVKFDASHLSSGIYFVRLTSENKTQLRKMMLLK